MGHAALDLDAREVLLYLNELGIRNISGEALRDFIIDLKKLIIYDLEYKNQAASAPLEPRGPERLHSASTFSSRTRSKHREQPVSACRRECRRGKENQHFTTRNTVSAPILRDKVQLPPRRACSCTKVTTEKKQETTKRREVTSSSNLIKVPRAVPQKKADPVSLYHHYLALWDKYKANVPGENSWAELRWSIRQKLAGDIQKPVQRKISVPTEKDLEKRRQGWVE